MTDRRRPAGPGAIRKALDAAVKVGPVTPADDAAVALARRYADALDATTSPDLLDSLGPKLLATLTALGLTGAGRSAKSAPAAPTVPDELQAKRDRAARRRERAVPR